MTEIHVQRKGRNSWRWLLAVAVVVTLLVLFADRLGNRATYSAGEVMPPNGTATDAATGTGLASQRFLLFVRDEAPDFGTMNEAHAYTRTGLTYLASALDEIARGASLDASIRARIAALREGAETLSDSAAAPQHAAIVAVVFRQAVDAMTDVQRVRFPDAADEVQAARAAMQRVSGEQPLTDQRQPVRAFFDAAVEAVRAMGAEGP